MLRNIVSLSIARLNRIRRKPLLEILIFLVKRSRQVVVHARDRIRMAFGRIELSDKEFFDKIELSNLSQESAKKIIEKRDNGKARAEIVAYMQTRTSPLFYFNRREKKQIVAILEKHFPESKRRTIELADEFLNHRFQLLGKNVNFDESIDWHFNVCSGKKWPLSFSPNIDYFSSNRPGDIKIPWELNRNQHFLVLGKAYWYTEDEKYAKEFTDQVSSWIKNNPYKMGINWMEGIEVATRLFSWIWAYNFFLDSKYFNEKIHFEFLKNIYMHAKFIWEHLSDKWLINNNHLLAEAAGLTLVGIMFPEFKDAQTWQRRGVRILEKEINAQILPDGLTWEQSTGYHKFVTDLCLHVTILMMKNKMKIPKTVLSKLGQMIGFLNHVTKPEGMIPLVGDEDQGRVIRIGETAYDDARSTITIGSVIFNKKDWFRIECEEAFWLLGDEALTNESKSVVPASRFFYKSGFMVMRDRDKYLLFSVGPRSSKYLHASHRHFDMLSFVLGAYGTYFIVDPGTYTYFGDFKWRKHFKSIKAHNTVVVDDKDPVDIQQVFESSRVALCKIQGYSTGNKFDWIAARYNGYKMMSHLRLVLFVKPEYWVIIDSLEGKGEHTYDQYFHFNYGVKTEFNKQDQSVIATNQDSNVKMIPLITHGLNSEILEGEVSPQYGVKVKAPVLRYRKNGETPQIFVTVLYPYKDGTIEEEVAKGIKVSQINARGKQKQRHKENEVTKIRIDFGKYVDYIICPHVEKQYASSADVNKGGKRMYIRKERRIN